MTEYVKIPKQEYDRLKNLSIKFELGNEDEYEIRLEEWDKTVNTIYDLQQEKQDLKEWLEEEIKEATDFNRDFKQSDITFARHHGKITVYKEVLERLG